MQLARPLKGVEQLQVIDRSLAHPTHPLPLDRALDEPTEVRRDRVVPDDVAELPPHVVADVDSRLVVARPRSRLRPG